MVKKIILDCDPGHDDALAMTLAVANPAIDLVAVTTSAGNQTPDKTLNNALRMLTLLKRPDIPVAAGAQVPLVKPLETAPKVHGETGLDGADLPEPGFFAPNPAGDRVNGAGPARKYGKGDPGRDRADDQCRPVFADLPGPG